MPDWFYRTVTQPLFFRMPAVRARDLALGFHEPADALALRAAGADLVEVDSGLVYTGPRPAQAHQRRAAY